MNEHHMSENICARHEVSAIDSDACPYCRIKQLEVLLDEYKDAECRAVKREGEALRRLAEALEGERDE